MSSRGSPQSPQTYVPEGGSAHWPFVLRPQADSPMPRWRPHRLLWRGIFQSIINQKPLKRGAMDYWRDAPRHWLDSFMRSDGAGVEHPSRAFVATQVLEHESVLDAGCGTGETYAALAAAGRAHHYLGVDSSTSVLDIARARYPAAEFRLGSVTTLASLCGERSFDVVLMRHVLEHQPDFEQPMHEAIAVSRRLAAFVFYLPPRALPFGIRSLDPRSDLPFHVSIYSQSVIERFLTVSGLSWQWHHNVGASRGGWLTGETNSILLVSRHPLAQSA